MSELPAESARLRRGLAISTTAVVCAMTVALGLAVAGLLSARRAAQNADAERVRVAESLAAQARAERLSGTPGRRGRALDAIRRAAQIQPAAAMRDDAVAALALVDLSLQQWRENWVAAAENIAVSPDLDLAAYSRPGEVIVQRFDDDTGVARWPLPGLASVVFSPDAALLAARTGDFVAGYEIASRRELFRIQWNSVHPGERLAFDQTGTLLAAGGTGEDIRLLHARTGRETGRISLPAAPGPFALSPSGQSVAAVCDGALYVTGGGSGPRSFPAAGTVTRVAWHPGGGRVGFGGPTGREGILDVKTGSILWCGDEAHRSYVDGILFSPDGTLMTSRTWSGDFQIWDATSGALLLATRAGFGLRFSPDSTHLAWYRTYSGTGVWRIERGSAYRAGSTHPDYGSPQREAVSLGFSPDGKLLCAASHGRLLLWDAGTLALLHQSPPGVTGAAFIRSDELLFARNGSLARLRLTRSDHGVEAGAETPVPVPFAGPIFGPFCNGPFCATAAVGDESGVIFDATRPTPPVPLRGLPLETGIATFRAAPGGKFAVFSGWRTRTTTVWDLEKGKPVAQLATEGGIADFSPDGRHLAAATNRGTRFYETGTWRETGTVAFDAATSAPGFVAFSPDGSRAAVTRTPSLVQIVRVHDLAVTASLQRPDAAAISGFAFAPGGRSLISATLDGRLHRWDFDAIEHELTALGLPPALTAAAPAGPAPAAGLALWLLAAAVAALCGAYTLRYQHRLIARHGREQEALRAAETVLMRGEKLRAIGTLAAGIAHDFRNLLSIINLSNGLLKRGVKSDAELSAETAAIERAVRQGDHLVRSMLGFSRRTAPGDPVAAGTDDPAAAVRETVAMLGQQFLSGTEVAVESCPGLPPAALPRHEFDQVIFNLLVNATEAMQGRGRLTISLRTRDFNSPRPPGSVLNPSTGPLVILEVRDTGPGIPPDILPRIFEPFFTTRHMGANPGTGLGLSIVFTICQRHGAGLAVTTSPGKGTAFCVEIPAGEKSHEF